MCDWPGYWNFGGDMVVSRPGKKLFYAPAQGALSNGAVWRLSVWRLSRISGQRAACAAGRLDGAYWLIGPGSAGLAQGCRCALSVACLGGRISWRPPAYSQDRSQDCQNEEADRSSRQDTARRGRVCVCAKLSLHDNCLFDVLMCYMYDIQKLKCTNFS